MSVLTSLLLVFLYLISSWPPVTLSIWCTPQVWGHLLLSWACQAHLHHWPLLHLKPWNVSGAGSQMKFTVKIKPSSPGSDFRIISGFAAAFAYQSWGLISKIRAGGALALALTLLTAYFSQYSSFTSRKPISMKYLLWYWYYARQKPTCPQNSRTHASGLKLAPWLPRWLLGVSSTSQCSVCQRQWPVEGSEACCREGTD